MVEVSTSRSHFVALSMKYFFVFLDASGGEATTSPRNGSYCQPPPPSAAAARGSARSTPNLPTTTPTHTAGRGSALNMPRVGRTPPPAPPPLMARTTTRLSTSSVVTPSQAVAASSTSSSSCTSPEHGAAVSAEDRAVLSRGITRSNASYGIQQMLQEQVSRTSPLPSIDRFLVVNMYF